MLKKLIAVVFILVLCGTSQALDVTNYDPYHLSSWYLDSRDEGLVYSRYGNTDTDFFYQLRDITGASRTEQVAGPQWFSTVYENYYYTYFYDRFFQNDTEHAGMYRRTMGGEVPEIPFSVIGDIIDGFNFVFAEEPEPYEFAWSQYVTSNVYDVYPDPVETLCLVITGGQAEFNVKMGNPYARHFPFWWSWQRTNTSTAQNRWWRNNYDWRNSTYPTIEAIKYIYSEGIIYTKDSNNNYVQAYTTTLSYDLYTSGDASSDTAVTLSRDIHYDIADTSGVILWQASGDFESEYFYVYDSPDKNIIYTVSGDLIYSGEVSNDVSASSVHSSAANLVYTIETDGIYTADRFICDVREVGESVVFSGFDNAGYSFTVNPSNEQSVLSNQYLNANVRVRGDAYNYGSTLGYITFRQRASFAPGYSNFREANPIPFVVANVSNGNASDNPLMFDMIVYNSSNDLSADVVNRIKFTWDAQNDMPDQDLGTFFMMTPYNASSSSPYWLETRITNRTGTRYELYRYDMIGNSYRATSSDVQYRGSYRNIMPDYWKYDLTQDQYGTLPDAFLLDAHSQIAPGLVTVYRSNVGSGYGTIDTQYDTSESFRLYEYSSPNPKNLRLFYRRVAGMTTAEDEDGLPQTLSGDRVSLQGFHMQFVDVIRNDEETEYELTNLMGKPPVMVPAEDSQVIPMNKYISSSAMNSFMISKDIEGDLEELAGYSEDVEPVSEDTEPEPVTPEPVTPEPVEDNENNENPETPETTEALPTLRTASYTTERIALQPVSIRLRIPRQSQLLATRWDYLDSAENARQLFERFAGFGAVWVRSSATREQDTNLFTAINNKGSRVNVSAGDCVRAFLYNDELYLDFIVLIADAKSINANRTAFVEIFKDDNIPYILIGDGEVDKRWELQFYVGATGANPDTREPAIISEDTTPSSSDVTSRDNSSNTNTTAESSSGGGGCNISYMGVIGLLVLAKALKKH